MPPAIQDTLYFHGFEFTYHTHLVMGSIVGGFNCPLCKNNWGLHPEPGSYSEAVATLRSRIYEHLYSRHFTPPHPTASAFANFIFEYNHAPEYSPHRAHEQLLPSLSKGRDLHALVELTRTWLNSSPDLSEATNYRAIYADSDATPPESLVCPFAILDKTLLSGRPDVVFQDLISGHTIIVERKFRSTPFNSIPDDGYENNRFQAWIYQWMGPWADRMDVASVLEYWTIPSENTQPAIRKRIYLSKTQPDLLEMGIQWLNRFGATWTGPTHLDGATA